MRVLDGLVSLSTMLNTASCGPKGYSLCARFWEMRLSGSRLGDVLVSMADTLFWFEKHHCYKAWMWRNKNAYNKEEANET